MYNPQNYNPLSGLPPAWPQKKPTAQFPGPLAVPSIAGPGITMDAPNFPRQKTQPFIRQIVPVESQAENSHPSSFHPGDPGWIAQHDGAEGDYRTYPGTPKDYSPNVAASGQAIAGMYDVNNPDSVPNVMKKEEGIRTAPISRTRQVLSGLAGV